MRVQSALRILAVAIAASSSAGQEIASAQSAPVVAETYYNTFSRARAIR